MITREQVIEVLRTVEDPELFLDIWMLGLVYQINIQEEKVEIKMTLTSPMCPAAPMLMEQIKQKVGALGVKEVDVQLVFDPPWEPSDELKALLGLI